jgi:hypothetical protein
MATAPAFARGQNSTRSGSKKIHPQRGALSERERVQVPRKQTFLEWLEIHKDLDAYIARGGKLMDLNLLDDATHKRLESVIAAELGQAANLRLTRFYKSIMDSMHTKRTVGEALTEPKLQALWRKTASNLK